MKLSKLTLALLCLFGWPKSVEATSYHPAFNNPQMIVVSFSIVSDNEQLRVKIPKLKLQREIMAYIALHLESEQIHTPVVAAGSYQELPLGVFEQNIVVVFVRADLTSVKINSDTSIVVGSVSVLARRDTNTLLSREPVTFFVAKEDEDIADQATRAALAQVQSSVVDPIIFFLSK